MEYKVFNSKTHRQSFYKIVFAKFKGNKLSDTCNDDKAENRSQQLETKLKVCESMLFLLGL